MAETAVIALILLALGAAAGLLAGLLGIGGGAVLVPGIYYILKHYGFTDNAMHVAVGTSLLTIILTGTVSARAHHKKGAVDLVLLKRFLPGVLIGVGAGTFIADQVNSLSLKAVFAASQILFGSYMLLRSNKPAPFDKMPNAFGTVAIAAANACLATLMGVGGGVQNVVFMTFCNVDMRRAVATAAAIGPFIAILGAAGFLTIGLKDANLPPYSIGYLNMPAFFCIIASSVLTAPLGVRLAHTLPVGKLKRTFSVFMLALAGKMIYEALS